MGRDVPDRDAVAQDQVGNRDDAARRMPDLGAVPAFPRDLETGFVAELVRPALGVGHVDDVVPAVLDLFAEGRGADDAGGNLDEPELVLALRVEQDRAVQPAGVGAVVLDQRGRLGVDRRVDVVAEGEPDLVVPVHRRRVHPGQHARSELDELLRLVEVGFAQPRELEAVGVVAVGAGKVFVVLTDHRDGPVADAELRDDWFVGARHGGGERGEQEQNPRQGGHADSHRP